MRKLHKNKRTITYTLFDDDRSSQLYAQVKHLWNLSLKTVQAWTGIEPMTSAIPVRCSTKWAIKPSGRWSRCEFVIYPYCKKTTVFIHLFLRSLNLWSFIYYLAFFFSLAKNTTTSTTDPDVSTKASRWVWFWIQNGHWISSPRGRAILEDITQVHQEYQHSKFCHRQGDGRAFKGTDQRLFLPQTQAI